MKAILFSPFRWFRSQSRRKKIIFSIIFVIFFLILFRFTFRAQGEEYQTEYPMYEPIVETVTETGNVVTSAQVDVYSTTNGVIKIVHVTNGKKVGVGDPLFEVTSTATQQEKSTARSNYLIAKNLLDAAKADQLSLQAKLFTEWDQYKNLAEGDKYEDGDGNPKNDNRTLPEFQVSQKEWLAAEATFKNQAQKISQTQAATTAAWEAYQATQDSVVKAPIAGFIYNFNSFETDSVLSKSQVGSAPVLVIGNLSYTRIKVAMNEVDIPKIKELQSVKINIDALPDKALDGHVMSVDTIGHDNQGVITYNVYIYVGIRDDTVLNPGMTATVAIEVARKESVLTVSSSAVRPYEGKRAVQIVDPTTKKPKYIPVEIGLRSDDRTEIISGIDENTPIITSLSNDQVDRPGGGIFGG